MKYLILVSFLSLLLACNSECACKLGAANVETITTLYGDFASGNIDGVIGAMAADVEWNEAENYIYADKNPYVGPDAILEGLFGRIGGEWNEFKVNNPIIMPVGTNQVLATGRYTGEYKATGKSMDAQFAHLWGLENGKVTSFQQYTDTKQAAEVVTVVEEDQDSEE